MENDTNPVGDKRQSEETSDAATSAGRKAGGRRTLPLVTAALAGGLAVAVGQFVWTGLQPAPLPDRAQFEKMAKEALLANPEWIPEAISRMQSAQVAQLLASNRQAIETPFHGAWAGNPDGDVTLVEFFDYNCPYCRHSVEDVERLLDEDPKLKVVFRDLPVLGDESRNFALASLSAAEQGRYLNFYRAVFAGSGALDRARLVRSVRDAGLKEGDVAGALHSADLAGEVEKNLDLARALGLNGTPSWVVGDEILSGAVGYDALKAAIAKARAGGKRAAPKSGPESSIEDAEDA